MTMRPLIHEIYVNCRAIGVLSCPHWRYAGPHLPVVVNDTKSIVG